MDTSQRGSLVPCIIYGLNSSHLSWLNNSLVADITQCLASTLSATLRLWINTGTARNSYNTPAPGKTLQTASTCRVVSRPASGIASTPTPISSLVYLPTPIHNPETRTMITNPLRTWGTYKNQGHSECQSQLQTVYTAWSMVFRSCSINRFVHSDMTWLVFATGRLVELYMWNRQRFTSGKDLKLVSDAMWRIATALAQALHWQIIETYWNTALQENNIWSIVFEARTKEILIEVCCRNGWHWILYNWYQVWAPVDKNKSHLIQFAKDNIADLYELLHLESSAERLEFIDSFLADSKYVIPIAENVEGGVRSPNPTHRE